MTTQTLQGTITTKANIFEAGKCVSHTVFLADGTKKTVGTILPGQLRFNVGAPEVMECTFGSCEYKLEGDTEWKTSAAGESFSVPANTAFDIRVGESYHYVCHFG